MPVLRPHSTSVSPPETGVSPATVPRVLRAPALTAFSLLLVLALASPAHALTRTFRPTADGSVRADAPNTSAGKKSAMRVAASPPGVAYLRFRVPGLKGRVVRRAFLRVYVSGGRRAGLELRRASGRSWSESSLTYRRRPSVTEPLAQSAAPRSGRTVTIDATSAVRTGGTVVLALAPGEAGSSTIAARENRRRAPQLVVRSDADRQPALPLRAAFYDTRDPGTQPVRHHPRARPYLAGRRATFVRQQAAFAYAGLRAGIIGWNPGAPASRTPVLNALSASRSSRAAPKWAVQLTTEAPGDPTPAEIAAQLVRLDRTFAHDPAYLRVKGRPVVFVRAAAEDTCAAVSRWAKGNAVGAHLVMDTVQGWPSCGSKPSDWYPDEPPKRAARAGRSSYVISPGHFAAADGVPASNRDLPGWASRVRAMRRSKARFQLVQSFNGWVDGTEIENAAEWISPTGFGWYLDVLEQRGAAPRESRVQDVGAVGDIVCDPSNQYFNNGQGVGDKCRHTAVYDVLRRLPLDAFLMLGDGQYETGQLAAWAAGYDKTFGNLRAITYPSVGNHEYLATPHDGKGYFDYWNGVGENDGPAGRRSRGYYSFDLGAWHLVSLNTNCSRAGAPNGCAYGSPQEKWLRADLQAHPNACTIAYFHQPLFSSGGEGPSVRATPLWRALRDYGTEVILNGHDHDYERFRMQTETGAADPSGGIRQWVVGTGGKNLIPFKTQSPATVSRDDATYGALELKLRERSYTWKFHPIAGKTYTDSGSGTCH
jgi:hypothetical protein